MKEKLLKIFEMAKPAYEPVIKENFDGPDKAFPSILKAAFAKSFEFNLSCNLPDNTQESYFLMSALRGICEDLISIKYIRDHLKTHRNKLIGLMVQKRNLEGIQAQQIFFKDYAPSQPIIVVDDTESEIQAISKEIKSVLIANGLKGDKDFPSVAQMATDTKLIKLYNYLYYATSKTVHFEPALLLRLGWSDTVGDTNFTFSTRNFPVYNQSFNSFYAAFLFVEFYQTFKKDLSLERAFKPIVKQIKKVLDEELRMPELVTYEELNIKPPSPVTRVLLKATSETKNK